MRCQKGAAAVEVAIIFPLLLAFVIAIAEYGIYFLTAYETEQVAYQAARAGYIASDDKETAANAEASRLITELGLSGYGPNVSVVVTPPNTPQGSYTQVTVGFNYQSVTGVSELPGIGLLFPSRIERTAAYQNF
ncbi:MAG: TadE/TadG family type IV pilus assembly protein [Thermodesulfovibrionales bacterium]|jgi:Flp pilus assembly protein TadG